MDNFIVYKAMENTQKRQLIFEKTGYFHDIVGKPENND